METFPSSYFFFARATVVALLAAVGVSAVAANVPARFRQVAAQSMVRGYVAEPLATTDTVRPGERAFLEKALGAGQLQTRLAELGASQAATTEVRSHAEQLKSDNRQLVDALMAIIQKKGPGTTPTGEARSESYAKLAGKSGADFDREFVLVMAALHTETISLFEQAAAESKDTDVRDLAAAQLPMLRAHLNRITELKKAFD